MEREWFIRLAEHLGFHFSMCTLEWTGVQTITIQINRSWIKHGYEPVNMCLELNGTNLSIYLGPTVKEHLYIPEFNELWIDESIDVAKTVAKKGLEILDKAYESLISTLGLIQNDRHKLEAMLNPEAE